MLWTLVGNFFYFYFFLLFTSCWPLWNIFTEAALYRRNGEMCYQSFILKRRLNCLKPFVIVFWIFTRRVVIKKEEKRKKKKKEKNKNKQTSPYSHHHLDGHKKEMEKQIPKYLFHSGFSEAYCNHILPHPPFVQIELMIHGVFYTAFPITFPHYFLNHRSPTKFSSTDSTKEILFLLSFPGKIPVHHYCVTF